VLPTHGGALLHTLPTTQKYWRRKKLDNELAHDETPDSDEEDVDPLQISPVSFFRQLTRFIFILLGMRG
jgi:hypothetical protein